MVEDGGEAHTINVCQQCYNEQLVQQGKQPLSYGKWRGVVEKKAHRRRIWKVMGNEHCFAAKARRDPRSVATGLAFRETLEQGRENTDMGCGTQVMRRGDNAMRDGSWGEFKERYMEE